MLFAALPNARWTRKPDPGTELDLGHSLCPDHCWPFLSPQAWAIDVGKRRGVINNPKDGAGGGSGLYSGSGSIVPGRKYGLSARHGATSDRVDLTPNTNFTEAGSVAPYDSGGGPGFTVLICSRKTDATLRSSTIFSNQFDGTSGIQRCVLNAPYSDGNLYWQWGGFVNGTTRVQVSGLTYGDDLFICHEGARGMGVWQNGILVGGHSTANPGRTGINITDWISLGNAATFSFTADLTDTALVMTWNRQLSDAQIRSLSVNPWQVFQPRVMLYAQAAAAGGGGGGTGIFRPSNLDGLGAGGKLFVNPLG